MNFSEFWIALHLNKKNVNQVVKILAKERLLLKKVNQADFRYVNIYYMHTTWILRILNQ